jgi:serine phosphatase RsbU (regulator of sigma subunit)
LDTFSPVWKPTLESGRVDTFPRTAALRWFAAAYLLVLGISFLILPRGPINPLYGLIWLRGPFFIITGLVLLWLCILRMSRRAWVATHLLAAVPPLAVAAQYVHLHNYAPAVTLFLLGIGIALSPFAPKREQTSAWRPDALGFILGLSVAAQGINLLAQPEPAVIPYGAQLEMAIVFTVFGLAVFASHAIARTPRIVRYAVHLIAGASLLVLWALFAVGVAAILWVLGVSSVLAGVVLMALPWLSARAVTITRDSVRARFACGLFTGSLIPLLIAVAIVVERVGVGEEVPVSARQAAFGIAIGLSIVAAVAGWWFARLLVVPLSRLVTGVEAIAAGRRPVKLASDAPQEVEELALAVEIMAGRLDQQMEELKAARDRYQAVAEKLQSALQATVGSVPGLDLACVYRSASELGQLGGDFYDVFPMADGRVGVLIGDVSGRGLDAAALAVVMRTSLRASAYYTSSPAQVLERANRLLLDLASRGFVTAFFGTIEPGSGELLCGSAGHPPAILLGAGGAAMLDSGSPVLGVFAGAAYKEGRYRLGPDDVLLLYTDGLTEAKAEGELFGEDRLMAQAAPLGALSPAELTQTLYSQVLAFAGGTLGDDLALLALRLSRA